MPAAGENFGFFVICIEFGALFQQWGNLLTFSLEVIENLQFNNINTEDDMPAAGENFGFFVICIEFGALFQQSGNGSS